MAERQGRSGPVPCPERALGGAVSELDEASKVYETDRARLLTRLHVYRAASTHRECAALSPLAGLAGRVNGRCCRAPADA